MTDKITFETYGTAKFYLEDWYTIEELEELIAKLRDIKQRQDHALLEGMQKAGVMK